RYLVENVIDIATTLTTEMEGSEVGESSDQVENLFCCLIVFDSERESETVSDGEKLFRDEGERVAVFIIHQVFEYKFPTLIG
ncbi:hypothetical protein L195_g045322, partial [Trifolium pratense]